MLHIAPGYVLIDGNPLSALPVPSMARGERRQPRGGRLARRLFWRKSPATQKWRRWISFFPQWLCAAQGYQPLFIWKSCTVWRDGAPPTLVLRLLSGALGLVS